MPLDWTGRNAFWRLVRFGLIAASTLIFASIVGVSALLWAAFPVREGQRSVANLRAPVSVEFDRYGAPTIHATSRADALNALGYVTAGDRLFQMDLLRRKSAGRLAEIFGESVLDDDIWARTVGLHNVAKAVLAGLAATERDALLAYADGVNAAMHESWVWPWEFYALGYRPDPWREEDSVLVALSLAGLSYSGYEERSATIMKDALPSDIVSFLLPDRDCFNEAIAPRAGNPCVKSVVPKITLQQLYHEAEKGAAIRRGDVSKSVGSNAWAIGRDKSVDGRAILASDMHLSLDIPNIWFPATLTYGKARVQGLTLPGVPMIISGTNGRVAWGFTNADGDFADLVRISSESGRSTYRTPGGERVFLARREIIRVNGGPAHEIEVLDTIWGPVLPEKLLGDNVALHWTMLDPSATNFRLLDMDLASSVKDALQIVQSAGLPPLNALVADQSGSIGWTLAGKIPKRTEISGLFSVRGETGAIGWTAYLGSEELPAIIDPGDRFISSANDRRTEVADWMSPGHDYPGGFRAWRIRKSLKQKEKIDEGTAAQLQLDTTSDFYVFYQELALSVLGPGGGLDATVRERIRAVIAAWDGRAETGSRGLQLLIEFRKSLIERIILPLLDRCRKLDPAFSYEWTNVDAPLQSILRDRSPEILPRTSAAPDWTQFLATILADSAKRVEGATSKPIDALVWGETSRVAIAHPLSAALGVWGSLLNMARDPVAGCSQCVRYNSVDGGASSGANARIVVAPSHESDGLFQMAGGQSGLFGSEHYEDQQADWVAGRYRALRGAMQSRLELIPSAAPSSP